MRTILIWVLLTCCALAQQLTPREKELLSNESKHAWTGVHWRADAASACADAQRDGKPILAFLVVGEHARKNACQV